MSLSSFEAMPSDSNEEIEEILVSDSQLEESNVVLEDVFASESHSENSDEDDVIELYLNCDDTTGTPIAESQEDNTAEIPTKEYDAVQNKESQPTHVSEVVVTTKKDVHDEIVAEIVDEIVDEVVDEVVDENVEKFDGHDDVEVIELREATTSSHPLQNEKVDADATSDTGESSSSNLIYIRLV